ncbi:unnamed protein product [Rodentolepis nana]|uniref:PH-like domain-containing protein n=1 Tax=Rodentolepis nana TaxID=102285 RepID=A0A3P7T6W4_RODNA|nr:unnamed protein product [Rodentolepis nana]
MMFIQNSLTDSVSKLKANRTWAEKLAACERDPRTRRRTITDCYLIIIQRWTKIETLLAGIISDTIVQDDSTELNDLNISRRAAQSLLLGAQQKLTDLVHRDKLRYFADNLKEDWGDPQSIGDPKHRTLLQWMKAPDAKLINYDKLAIQCRKEGGKICNIELYGVALQHCFFLLRQDPETGKFSLFRESSMPPILIWTKHFGYFRDQAGSPLTFIILMDSDRTKDPTLTKFICSTHDEVARWQKIFSEGFDNFGKPEESEMESMLIEKNTQRLEAAEERRKRQEKKLELINQLSADIFSQWEVRNIAFRTLFVDEGLTISASRSNSGRSTNTRRSLTSQSDSHQQAEDEQTKVRTLHDRFMKNVMQLASLCGDSDVTCLSRSASDAADRRASYSSTSMPPPMPDANGDSKKRGDKDNVTFRIKPKSQIRLSNLLRTGSRRRGEGSSSEFPREYLSSEVQDRNCEVSFDSSLTSLTNPNLLVAEIQDLALALLETYENQYLRRLELEKDNLRLKTEVELTGGQTSINTKRELEYLRSLQKKIEDEQAAWTAQKQREEARLEREDQKLKNLAKNLEEKQEQYERDSRTLQEQIDLHASRGIDMGRLRGDFFLFTAGSATNLHSLDVEKPSNTSLTHNISCRSEGSPDRACLQTFTVKGHRNYFPASVPRELGDRRNVPFPSSPKPRTASNESQYGRYANYTQNPANHPVESNSAYHPNPVPLRPPTGPAHVSPQQPEKTQRQGSITNALGSLPTKLASKTRSSKSFLRH